jgi:hypothetical protein
MGHVIIIRKFMGQHSAERIARRKINERLSVIKSQLSVFLLEVKGAERGYSLGVLDEFDHILLKS